jgi:hypothetical protein
MDDKRFAAIPHIDTGATDSKSGNYYSRLAWTVYTNEGSYQNEVWCRHYGPRVFASMGEEERRGFIRANVVARNIDRKLCEAHGPGEHLNILCSW